MIKSMAPCRGWLCGCAVAVGMCGWHLPVRRLATPPCDVRQAGGGFGGLRASLTGAEEASAKWPTLAVRPVGPLGAHDRAPRSAHQALTARSVPEPEMALSHLLTIWSTSPGSPPLDSFATSGQDARITESVDHNSSHQAFSHRDRRQSAGRPTAHGRSESTPKARRCAL